MEQSGVGDQGRGVGKQERRKTATETNETNLDSR
jgi:hypothetical protein